MAKRKQNRSRNSIDIVRWGIITALVLVAVVISWLALSSYLRHSGLFTIRNVVIADGLGAVSVPELAKFKGRNIFSVDLEKVQAKLVARYPQIAELKVLRRFPDEIEVSGLRRQAYASVLTDGRSVAVSRDGYFIGTPGKEDGPLVLVRGVRHQKSSTGIKVEDPALSLAFHAIEQIQKDAALAAFPAQSLDVSDPNKLTFVFGRTEDPARFEVIVDKGSWSSQLKTLSVMIARTELAINEVKYIDLRFDTPVIGKKKAKK